MNEADRSIISLQKNKISVFDPDLKSNCSKNSKSCKYIKILLVEDEKLIRKAGKRIIENRLKSRGISFEVVECNDAAECIICLYNAFIDGRQFDFILTDQHMNFMSGNILLYIINYLIGLNILTSGLKVYMITSYIDENSKNNLLKYKFLKDIFNKPLMLSDVDKIF